MTEYQLLRGIGEIDEKIIEESDRIVPKKHVTRWIALAACCCLVCFGAFKIGTWRAGGVSGSDTSMDSSMMVTGSDVSDESTETDEMYPQSVSTLEEAGTILGYQTSLPQQYAIKTSADSIMCLGNVLTVDFENGMSLVKYPRSGDGDSEIPVEYDDRQLISDYSVPLTIYHAVGAEDGVDYIGAWSKDGYCYNLYFSKEMDLNWEILLIEIS